MKEEASKPETVAAQGAGPKVLESRRRAEDWALDLWTEIEVTVDTSALRSSL